MFFSGDHLTATAIARKFSEEHDLGEIQTVFRAVRHFTNQGLLETVGAVNIGTGRKRLYAPSALILAAILMRLHAMRVTVGFMNDTMRALKRELRDAYGTADIIEACERLKRPIILIFIPRGQNPGIAVRLRDYEEEFSVRGARDATIIEIGPYLDR